MTFPERVLRLFTWIAAGEADISFGNNSYKAQQIPSTGFNLEGFYKASAEVGDNHHSTGGAFWIRDVVAVGIQFLLENSSITKDLQHGKSHFTCFVFCVCFCFVLFFARDPGLIKSQQNDSPGRQTHISPAITAECSKSHFNNRLLFHIHSKTHIYKSRKNTNVMPWCAVRWLACQVLG